MAYTDFMILTLTDVNRLVDQELRFKLALLERSATKAGASALERARVMGDLFCEYSVWPAMTDTQLVWAMGQLCQRACDTQDDTVAQAVVASCLLALLGTYGRTQTVELGVHGQCLAAIDGVTPLQDLVGADASFVSRVVDARAEARKGQLRAIAQTFRCRPQLAGQLYELVMIDCLRIARSEPQDVIDEAKHGNRGVGAPHAVRALLDYGADLPDFLTCVMHVWGERVKEMVEASLPEGVTVATDMAGTLGLMSVLGHSLPSQDPDVARPWIEAWVHLGKQQMRGWDKTSQMGVGVLKRAALEATALNLPQVQPGPRWM